MSANELEAKVAKMQEWEAMAEDAKAEAESLRDEIKAELLAQDTEEIRAGKYIIRWTTTIRNVFDSTSFKKVIPDVYKAYTRESTSRRFTISA